MQSKLRLQLDDLSVDSFKTSPSAANKGTVFACDTTEAYTCDDLSCDDNCNTHLFRPLPGQPSHRTVVPNVHMLGAATWPGHGINGGSGYIVAQELLGTHKHAEKMAGAV